MNYSLTALAALHIIQLFFLSFRAKPKNPLVSKGNTPIFRGSFKEIPVFFDEYYSPCEIAQPLKGSLHYTTFGCTHSVSVGMTG